MLQRFKQFMVESHESGDKPHHVYHTKHGHELHVHLEKDEGGTTAHVHNMTIGGHVVKTVHWRPGEQEPTKEELEKMNTDDDDSDVEDEDLHESVLSFTDLFERAPVKEPKPKTEKQPKEKELGEGSYTKKDGSLNTNAGGVVTELAAWKHLHNHAHKMAGTLGSPEHQKTMDEIDSHINKIVSSSPNPEKTKQDIQLRIYHGRQAAADVIRGVRSEHGRQARIVNAGWTSRAGDISRFTRGHHNDGQENTSDVAVEIGKSSKKGGKPNSEGNHFEGTSLKSSLKKAEITAKNPSANLDGMLDHPSRKLQADEVGRAALEKHVHGPLGTSGKSLKEKEAILNAEREKHAAAGGAEGKSPYELKANAGGKKAIADQNHELHTHINHIAGLPNGEGHKMIGNMVVNHLFPDTDMPLKKTKVFGEEQGKIRSVTEPSSDHPLKKILRDPKTQFRSVKNANGGALHIEASHPDLNNGKHFKVWTAASKPKSNASKAGNMGLNVKAAAMK